MEKFSDRTSTILPLPSSPHWAPTMTAVLPFLKCRLRNAQTAPSFRERAHAHSSPQRTALSDYRDMGSRNLLRIRFSGEESAPSICHSESASAVRNLLCPPVVSGTRGGAPCLATLCDVGFPL